jgi:hypothetical protein
MRGYILAKLALRAPSDITVTSSTLSNRAALPLSATKALFVFGKVLTFDIAQYPDTRERRKNGEANTPLLYEVNGRSAHDGTRRCRAIYRSRLNTTKRGAFALSRECSPRARAAIVGGSSLNKPTASQIIVVTR